MNKKIIGDYKHPKWLIGFGIIVILATLYLSIATIIKL
jgi:Mn2+/Fe2+ NRAMP family transporter